MTPQTLLVLALVFIFANFLQLPYMRNKCKDFFSLKLAREKSTSYRELQAIAWVTGITALAAHITAILAFPNIETSLSLLISDYPTFIDTIASSSWLILYTTWIITFFIKIAPMILKVRFAKTPSVTS